MANMVPIGSLMKRVKDRPETTISLFQALNTSRTTVGTYFFTPSIQEFFEKILGAAGSKHGGGYWVQAEYGAGKTHFLATLSCLLMDTSEELWNELKNESVRNCRRRLEGKKLFPVILSLKGEAGVDKADNLLNVVLDQIKEELGDRNLSGKISITTEDELINWYETRSPEVKNPIDSYIEKQSGGKTKSLSPKTLASLIGQYCQENIGGPPPITSSTKKRIAHIYNQLLDSGYDALLIVIDEFEAWQRRHAVDTAESAQDEEVLETLAWVLPRDMNLEIYTIVASQMEAPAKLRGDRFINLRLLANEQDYEIIVSQRVRELIPENQPEVAQYYEYYWKEFKFLKNSNREYFYQIFPFQPRCFEVIRHITERELPTARLGIGVIYDCLGDSEILSRTNLITVNDLMVSKELVDAMGTTSYKDPYNAYLAGMNSLSDFSLDDEELSLAKWLLTTLFLWHIAYLDTPRPMSVLELTEATLTSGDVIKGEDLVEVVLEKLRDLPQISYRKDKGARFVVTREGEAKPAQIFMSFQKKITDISQIQEAWDKGLLLQPQETGGEESFFSGYKFDERKRATVEFRKLEYPGEVIVTRRWRAEYGENVTNDLHFRIVILTGPESIDVKEIKDFRIGVCVPSSLTEAARDAARDYLALSEMEEAYRDKTGSEAEQIRSWLQSKRPEVVRDLLRKQLGIYRNGTIITAHQLGIVEKNVFLLNKIDKVLDQLVPTILADAYAKPVVDSQLFKKNFSGREARNVFEGLFKKANVPAATSACINYAPALKLSTTDKPTKFNPSPNKVFELIENRVKAGEVQIWKLFEELHNQGLTNELINLYLLAFVRNGKPNVEISLRTGHSQPVDKITSFNIPQVNWRARLEIILDTLYPSSEESWNDILPFAKIVNPNLKMATAPDDVTDQERQLLQVLDDTKNQIPRIIENLRILYGKLAEDIPESKIEVIEKIKEITDVKNYGEFYAPFKDKDEYPDENAFRAKFDEFKKLKAIADQSTEIVTMKSYLNEVVLPEENTLSGDLLTIGARLKLNSLVENPTLAGSIKGQFRQFKDSYQNQYQIHHRDYYKTLKGLFEKVEEADAKIAAIIRLDKILESEPSLGKVLEEHHKDLATRVVPCPNKDPVSVENSPLCQGCRLTLTAMPPKEEVEEFLREVGKGLKSNAKKMSQALTKTILEKDSGKKLDKLIKIIQVSDLVKLSEMLSDDMVVYIKKLFKEAKVITESIGVLSRIRERFAYVDEENVDELIEAFKDELKEALKEAKKKNPGKKVRISLQ
ncbi:hypothetical protein HKBW3S42_00422 [Candidatus Hakubella thermalkaliphila]|uniref:Uncharacterized protein n=1 Tax=Candidatus Hakubella thermalkaliphila TaxID=2754717 RepID=A0A6V8PIR1_9ACTN|nr:hypothetical protein HKBW3S42_00422 [Candidatus Hakubella thermalkaliphila]